MIKRGSPDKLRIVRHAIREDLLQFALPALTVFTIELWFCRYGLPGIWSTLWGLITHPQRLLQFPAHSSIGLVAFLIGFAFLLLGHITLGRNYSGTVVIREGHQLITHGIYRFTRNPMYLGVFLILLGLPVYVASLYGFLTGLVLIPLFLNRIRLEERLLAEQFQGAYQAYKGRTKRLIPFIY
jgi:protein-S-isoprenylcysteine O-methyltransferase Ste14